MNRSRLVVLLFAMVLVVALVWCWPSVDGVRTAPDGKPAPTNENPGQSLVRTVRRDQTGGRSSPTDEVQGAVGGGGEEGRDPWTLRVHGVVVESDGAVATGEVVIESLNPESVHVPPTTIDGRGEWTALVAVARPADAPDVLYFRAVRPSTGERSAIGTVHVTERGGATSSYLRLNPATEVVGRIDDPTGAPVEGALVRLLVDHDPAVGVPVWASNEGADQVVEVTSDEAGRFRAAVRSPGRVRVSVREHDTAAFSAGRWWQLPAEGGLDLGSIRSVGDSSTTWTVRFIDSKSQQGVPGVRLRFSREVAQELPPVDSAWATGELSSAADGLVTIRLAPRPEPVWFAAGSATHETRWLRLDASSPGERWADIPLVPRVALHVICGGADQEALMDAGRLVTDRGRSNDRADTQAWDVAHATRVDAPDGALMWTLLEDELVASEPRVTKGGWTLHARSGCATTIALELAGALIAERTVAPPVGAAEWSVELVPSHDRFARVDWSRLRNWLAREVGDAVGLPMVAAWPAGAVRSHEGGASVLPRGTPIVRLRASESLLPLGQDQTTIEVGYLEPALRTMGGHVVVGTIARLSVEGPHPVRVPVPELSAPVPRLLEIRLRGGESGRLSGVPILVRRRVPSRGNDHVGAPIGNVQLLAGPTGGATIWALPGTYECFVPADYVLRSGEPGAGAAVPITVPESLEATTILLPDPR